MNLFPSVGLSLRLRRNGNASRFKETAEDVVLPVCIASVESSIRVGSKPSDVTLMFVRCGQQEDYLSYLT